MLNSLIILEIINNCFNAQNNSVKLEREGVTLKIFDEPKF